jgi:hypothetical protein
MSQILKFDLYCLYCRRKNRELNDKQTCKTCQKELNSWSAQIDSLGKLLLNSSRNDFPRFIKNFLDLKIADFQIEIVNSIGDKSIDRLLVVVPREHGKSTLIEAYIAWYMIFNPQTYVMIFSATLDQAKERSINIRLLFERNKYLTQFIDTRHWGSYEFYLANGSRCVVGGVGKQVAGANYGGKRPELIICDDLVPFDKANISDDLIEKWFKNILSNLGGPKTKIVVVGTPYRQTDIISFLKENERYKQGKGRIYHYEALLGKDAGALTEPDTRTLWPERWDINRLQDKLLEVGSLVFARNYLCRYVSSGAQLYPDDVVDLCRKKEIPLIYKRSLDRKGKTVDFQSIVGGADLAISAQTGADYFVVTTYGVTRKNRRFQLLDMVRYKGLSYSKQKSLIRSLHERYQYDLFVIESNQYQKVLAQELAETSSIPVLPYHTGSEVKDFEKGLPRIRTHMENSRYIFPDPDDLPEVLKTFYFELGGYIIDESGKLIHTTKHNDTVMSNWLATIACEKVSYRVRMF